MRSDHLSKHIRTHSNQRQSAPARAEIIGQVAAQGVVTNVVGQQQVVANPQQL